MKITVVRQILGKDATIGEMFIDGEHICFTCEDAVRPIKIAGITAIPAGIYKVIMTFSNHFQKVLPLLLNVPNYEGVRIHSGNTPADTEGCLIVGLTHIDNAVQQSRDAMAELMPKLNNAFHNNEEITLEIA